MMTTAAMARAACWPCLRSDGEREGERIRGTNNWQQRQQDKNKAETEMHFILHCDKSSQVSELHFKLRILMGECVAVNTITHNLRD